MDKGQFNISKELVLWFVRIVIVIIVVLVILSFLEKHVQRQLDIDYLRSDILIERLYFSQDCFSYDEGGEIKSGIIDINKFNELTLNNCIKYHKSHELNGVGLILNLTYGTNSKLIYINKRVANKFPAFCSDEKKFACYSKENYVLIKDDSQELKKGVLKIDTIQIK